MKNNSKITKTNQKQIKTQQKTSCKENTDSFAQKIANKGIPIISSHLTTKQTKSKPKPKQN
jgi:hypothetical protein